MDLVLGWDTLVGIEAGHAVLGASQSGTEELVQVGEQLVLVAGGAVGRLVHYD